MRGPKSANKASLRSHRITPSAAQEAIDNLLRHRCRFQLRRVVEMTADQHAGLERFDRQRLALEHLVRDLEAGALEALDPAFYRDPVAMGRRDMEFRPCIHHGNADQSV